MNILADATLPGLDMAFPAPFFLTRYTDPQEIPDLLANQDILLCRSTLKVNKDLLKNHQLRFVATASSGTDHLDQHYLKSENITIIDAKGCNATSVADYVVSSLAYLEQQHLLKGKKATIIGMGRVGNKVYQRLNAANFQIFSYDPLKAHLDNTFQSTTLEQLYDSDLLCVHAELHDSLPYPSVHLIDQYVLSQLKPGCVIINASRGGIVDENALLNTQQVLIYCTDVYLNEPAINSPIIEKATLCTPHIAGHSLEAKYAAVALVSEQLHRLAKLPVPQFAVPTKPQAVDGLEYTSWQELALSLYNPALETEQLKQASDKKTAFLTLRKQHQKRHDFSSYFDAGSMRKIPGAELLGLKLLSS